MRLVSAIQSNITFAYCSWFCIINPAHLRVLFEPNTHLIMLFIRSRLPCGPRFKVKDLGAGPNSKNGKTNPLRHGGGDGLPSDSDDDSESARSGYLSWLFAG